MEGQLDESRAKVSSLEAECGEKRDETDKLRQEMDALSQTHRVSSTLPVTLRDVCPRFLGECTGAIVPCCSGGVGACEEDSQRDRTVHMVEDSSGLHEASTEAVDVLRTDCSGDL